MNRAVDVPPDHLQRVKAILQAHLPAGVKVYAFGSRARGRAKKFSDLDLCLRGAGRVPAKALSAIDRELEESDLPYRVEGIDWHAIRTAFQQVIDKDLVEIDLRTEGQCRLREDKERDSD